MKSIVSVFLSLLAVLLLFSACSKEHVHQYSAWQTTSPASCIREGLRMRSCTEDECSAVETEAIPATGHHFGEWIAKEDSSYHACSVCGYREFQYHENNGNQNQGIGGLPATNPILAEYPNFDTFLADCKSTGGEIWYNGSANTFEVNFSDGIDTCDYYTVHIPSRITDVKFSCSTSGTPIQDLKIVIDDRATDINIYFEDIMIESTETILESQTRNINVTVYMEGSKCSFEVAKGTDGRNGEDKVSVKPEAEGGQDGQHGTSAMLINGNCQFVCSAQEVILKGGDGGNGGNGGNVKFPWAGVGGWGGHGGNGANAVAGETLASVIVLNNASVNFSGGLGGDGGSGGGGRGWEPDGDPGRKGTDGTSGCKTFVYQQQE